MMAFLKLMKIVCPHEKEIEESRRSNIEQIYWDAYARLGRGIGVKTNVSVVTSMFQVD